MFKNVSSKQKGSVIENRAVELITLGSDGQLTCYLPQSDDDGIDIIVNKKGHFQSLYLQVKSRFALNGNQFIQNVGISTFSSHESFYLLFFYFNTRTLEIECVWLIPSMEFEQLAYLKKAGATYKEFYRFSANPYSDNNQWSKFRYDKTALGNKLLSLLP
ncbi:hypothetical protein [Bacillus sp. MRMR6]|uniref:hypothetical protein n=1 Tax=Bacillus sp. MRMR6 TaxID=1928617 RepID=UPI000951D2C2|nr:hypothetical protein [Bacillus sp. MRMR6]OLS37728.1 hypothetical protein BTR25_15540 [Bacillus sp. MRMR6]